MPKNSKKRSQVKDLPRSKDELSAKSAKQIKGGLPAVQGSSLSAAPANSAQQGGV